ncbi:MAG: large subunit ribosomal protein L6 [Candidatus Berkelbacteria bacterium Licking1014_7]|uniref:50S ribosomal protein L6 n=1 Tax=Candidatus Berkelbacteria bacterium Licking1014_7 TaxID=2017147 RepID=A0A554LKK1_9BACT|nr:MAG: large subunit ribosomal protein L6 [Candidatus Berkelbacteria bacterium Licking1014_7]
MSRIGKKSITLEPGVLINVDETIVEIKGPLGILTLTFPKFIEIKIENNLIKLSCSQKNSYTKPKYGLYRSLLSNAIIGVSKGFEKILEVRGVGYDVSMDNNKIILNLGFSHSIEIEIPKDIKVQTEKNLITISGIDKQKVGEFAAKIKSLKKPDPYKGKGIRYQNELIKLKPGKAAKTAGA